ncbi:hypothetical protein SHI21_13585 [Bacteriovorax sp. PP10]|uniref:Outer membrane lipoprotein n=1 Tax=Bacteriovorax antarcticus TaxID=3088717 RepID=A0ABU5VW14_9BACT|nr:hypothetical protein [Bacteriovorax sp. PP10]MEA9357251.1 hypothetical protein [Bacteriovorax sp. PP10]
MRLLSIMFLMITLSSCASTSVTPESKKLIIINDVKYAQGCTPVARVFASSSNLLSGGNPLMGSIGNSNSLTQLRNQAAKFGQVLYIYKNKESVITGSEREGIVFKCPPHIVFKSAAK